MKILQIHNRHKEPSTYYGYKCYQCGTIFTFTNLDVKEPISLVYKKRYCTVRCPNCSFVTSLDQCREFKNENECKRYERKYSKKEGLNDKN